MTQKMPKYELKLLFKNRVNISIGIDSTPKGISDLIRSYLDKINLNDGALICPISDYEGTVTNFDVRELIVWTTMLIPLESDILVAKPTFDAMGKIVNGER